MLVVFSEDTQKRVGGIPNILSFVYQKMGKSNKPMSIFDAKIKSILFGEYTYNLFYLDNKTRLALY